MKRLAVLALLLAVATAAHGQQQQILCQASPSTPCTVTGPVNTGTGDPPYKIAGKSNANFGQLYGMFGASSQLAATGAATPTDIAGTLYFAPELAGSATYRATACPNTTPGTTDMTTCVQNAINAANAAGGGIVLMQAQTYYTPGGLQSKAGVKLQGAGCTINNTTFAYSRGTRLLGNNTAAAISYVPTTYTSPTPTLAQVLAAWQYNVGVEGMCIDTFTYGLQFGGLYNSGAYNGSFRNLIVLNPSQWGMWFENTSESIFEGNYVYNPTGTVPVGGFMYRSSHQNYNHGNSHFRHNYINLGSNSTAPGTRPIAFEQVAGSFMNDVDVYDIQTSTSGIPSVTQAATMVSGFTAFAVTNSAVLPPDLPVTVSATANGFTQWRTYYVLPFGCTAAIAASAVSCTLASQNGTSVNWAGTTGSYTLTFSDGETRTVTLTNGSNAVNWSSGGGGLSNNVTRIFTVGNEIQLSALRRGPPVAATGNTAINILSYGWELLDIMGWSAQYDPTPRSVNAAAMQASKFDGVDMEGAATTLITVGGGIHLDLNYVASGGPQGTNKATDLTFRAAAGTWRSNIGSMAVDFDFTSQFSMFSDGSPFNDFTSNCLSPGLTVGGTSANPLPQFSFNANSLACGLATFVSQAPTSAGVRQAFTYAGTALGQYQTWYTFACNFTLQGNDDGIKVIAATSSGTCSLPTLDSNPPGTASASQGFLGSPWWFVNSNAGVATLAASGGQNFMRNSGITSYTVQPYGSVMLQACWDGTNPFWCVLSVNGAAPTGACLPANPTISSGFGTGASVTHCANDGGSTGMSFSINVGTGGTASSGVIGLPTALDGWACSPADVTTPATNMTQQTASSTTSASVTNYVRTTGVAGAWTASDVLQIRCTPN